MSYPINDLSGSFRNNDAVLGEEIVSLRTRHGKVFALGANRFQAVTYTEPVHILNSLTGRYDEMDASFYQTR